MVTITHAGVIVTHVHKRIYKIIITIITQMQILMINNKNENRRRTAGGEDGKKKEKMTRLVFYVGEYVVWRAQ